MEKIIKKINKGIIKDFGLNIIASILMTLATQILAYPFLSRIMSSSEYGLLLTVMGVVNAVGVSLGNPLNNTRILLESDYKNSHTNGDYNIIFVICLLVDICVVTTLSMWFLAYEWISIFGCVVISSLVLFRAYYSVSFRIVINYKKILFTSVWALIGYLFGIMITYITDLWVFTFLFGELFSCIYIYFSASIVHDKFKVTNLFKRSLKKYSFILSAAILSTVMTYMDRFFIFPFLGSEHVSIYNVASFLGKTAGIVMSPIAGVLLTYYARESRLTLAQFYKRMCLFFGFATFFYLMILLAGLPITGVLYPTLIEGATPFFAIANLATTIFILGNTIQPTLLRFCNVKWQPVIQGVYLLLYFILGIIGMRFYGLRGFCYAVLISNTIKILFMILITTFTLRKNDKNIKMRMDTRTNVSN